MLDAFGQVIILQQHQVHIQQGGQLMRSIFGHVSQQTLQFIHHGISASAHTVDFCFYLACVNEIVGHVHAAHQHCTPNGDAARDSQSVN